MDRIHFVVFGEPQGKARPRVTRYVTYTPKKTMEYEQKIRCAFLTEFDGGFWDKDIPLDVAIDAFYSIPKSAPKKKSADMLANRILPMKKPDVDNIVKVVLDALNKTAFHDDAQVVKCTIRKAYSNTPRIEVDIMKVPEEDPA